MERFFVGLHLPSAAQHFQACCISVNRLRDRKSDFVVQEWILDSGAFSTILRHGGYPAGPDEYVAQVNRWASVGNLLAAVTQDYMCEPFMLQRTGGSVRDHQQWTVDRYDAIRSGVRAAYVMPVLQGYRSEDYLRHIDLYGDRIQSGAWVGVGSVCKRNAKPTAVRQILECIHALRPDLRLHGFGLKRTALEDPHIFHLLYSADSMAWSYAARREGRNANDWREAEIFVKQITRTVPDFTRQLMLPR